MTTAVPSAAGGAPRLTLEPTASRGTLLDGAWWPRSDDLLAALPALVLALDDRRGRVTHLMLGAGMSTARPTRLAVAGRRVRLGWFASQPAGLLTAICGDAIYGNRERIDLLVVPPTTSPTAAARAMATAADAANTLHALDILTGVAPDVASGEPHHRRTTERPAP